MSSSYKLGIVQNSLKGSGCSLKANNNPVGCCNEPHFTEEGTDNGRRGQNNSVHSHSSETMGLRPVPQWADCKAHRHNSHTLPPPPLLSFHFCFPGECHFTVAPQDKISSPVDLLTKALRLNLDSGNPGEKGLFICIPLCFPYDRDSIHTHLMETA